MEKKKRFWNKVLQRLVAIILTICILNLALRDHRQSVHDGLCEDGNFLRLFALMAQFDDALSGVISLPYLTHKIQEELVYLIGNALRRLRREN